MARQIFCKATSSSARWPHFRLLHHLEMVLSSPKPQFLDGLISVLAMIGLPPKNNRHLYSENGNSGDSGLPGQFFIFLGGKPERPPFLKSNCRLLFFHLPFLPF